MSNEFTTKEMVIMIMDDIKTIKEDFKDHKLVLNQTHENTVKTNGTVKLHTKIIWSLWGVVLSGFALLTGWFVRYLV